ncbi:MAG: C4-dicarboxylate TRAP transporter substrate-binding protein [Pigmentiphaga sp.]
MRYPVVSKLALSMLLGLGLSASALAAKEITVAPGVPPSHEAFAPYAKFATLLPEITNGEYKTRELGMEVVNLSNALDALKSYMTDVAQVLSLYTPAELPNTVFISELAALGEDGHVMGAATTEYMLECGECMAEFKRLGLVYTGSLATQPYYILSTKPVRTMADLEGLRLRSGGSPFSRWATELGAVPVQMSTTEQYEAISNGLLDGTLNPPAALIGARLGEVVKYVTPMPIGTFQAAMGFILRQDVWQGMSPEQRAAFIKAATIASAEYAPSTAVLGERGIEEGKARGLEVVVPAEDLLAANRAFAQSDMATVAEIGRTRYRVKDPEAKIQRYQELVAKWTQLLDGKGNDSDQIGQIVYDELWSNRDMSKFGN